MSRLLLIRHGQTEWNLENRLQGRQDSPLTPRGIEQARALAQRLAPLPLDELWASSAPRAQQTARILLQERRQPTLQTSSALQEMHFGAWEGLTKTEIAQTYGSAGHHFWHAPELFTPFGGESFEQAQTRVGQFLSAVVARQSASATLAFVTHGVLIRLILHAVSGQPLAALKTVPVVEQTSLSLIEAWPDRPWHQWQVTAVNLTKAEEIRTLFSM